LHAPRRRVAARLPSTAGEELADLYRRSATSAPSAREQPRANEAHASEGGCEQATETREGDLERLAKLPVSQQRQRQSERRRDHDESDQQGCGEFRVTKHETAGHARERICDQ